VDAFESLLIFRWLKRAVGLVLVVGFLAAPAATSQLVLAMIEKRAAGLCERFTETLRPVLARAGRGAAHGH
jgi:hypothetical protein